MHEPKLCEQFFIYIFELARDHGLRDIMFEKCYKHGLISKQHNKNIN